MEPASPTAYDGPAARVTAAVHPEAAMLKPALVEHFQLYADYHRHPMNRLTHKVAIPVIVFHIIAMLDWVALATLPVGSGFTLTLGHVGFAGAIGWYLSLNVRLALIMAVAFGVCFPLAAVTPTWAVVALAAVGWLVQLAGHLVWEKRSPAFLTNLLQALIGPLFFVALLTGDWPQRPAERDLRAAA